MAKGMRPGHESRAFGAAVDTETLSELRHLEMEIPEDDRISELNGVLPGLAAAFNVPGACLVAEIPHLSLQSPFPKASLAVPGAFCAMGRVDPDLSELAVEADSTEEQLYDLLYHIDKSIQKQRWESEESPGLSLEAPPEALPEKSKQDSSPQSTGRR